MSSSVQILSGAIVAALLLPAAARAEDAPPNLVCRFETGYTWSYEGGKFQSSEPKTLSFGIEAIDLDKQTASLVLDSKNAGTLRVVRALNANSFLEVAQEGFLNLTTVYDKDPATGGYPAVHSRHFGLLGSPMFAQYAGTCTPK